MRELELVQWHEGDLDALAIIIEDHRDNRPWRTLTFAGGVGTWPLTAVRCRLGGWLIVESTGAAAAAGAIVNGAAAGAPALGPIALPQSGTSHLAPADRGILADAGLAVVVTSGSMSGVLYYLPLH